MTQNIITHCIITVTGYFRHNLAGLSRKRREIKNKITYFIMDCYSFSSHSLSLFSINSFVDSAVLYRCHLMTHTIGAVFWFRIKCTNFDKSLFTGWQNNSFFSVFRDFNRTSYFNLLRRESEYDWYIEEEPFKILLKKYKMATSSGKKFDAVILN